MIATLLAAAALAALPEGVARYRAELAGEPIGFVEFRIACSGATCQASYESRFRAPAVAGGAVQATRVQVEVDRHGRWRGGRIAVRRDAARADAAGVQGAVPAAILEVVLAAEAGASTRCVSFFEEENPVKVDACVRLEGGRAVADADGIEELIVTGADGFPAEVLAAGRLRIVRDAAAQLPARPPKLFGARVPGPANPAQAHSFCQVTRDPAPPTPRTALPPPRAAGMNCREKTAAWMAAVRRRGHAARIAVGVAWDGTEFVWHAWAEVLAGGAWIPVDPSFGELPARGPRFTVARYGPGDAHARNVAGARVLACWGWARVEAAPVPAP